MKLNNKQCESFKPAEKAYKKSDGGGLYLEIMPNGSRYWRMKYRFLDKEKRLAFGVYPDVSLAEARTRRDEAKALLRNGHDPALVKKEQKRLSQISAENSFEKIAREWHAHNINKWTEDYGKDVLHRMERDIFPNMGAYPITGIMPPLVLETIRKIEARGAHEIARRNLQCCGQVFRYAIGEGKAETDPTRDLTGQLKPFKKSHYAALDVKDLPAFLQALDRNEARLYGHTVRAMKLLMLTFVRTSELIQATWDEFDLDEGTWTIPAERMKMRRAVTRYSGSNSG